MPISYLDNDDQMIVTNHFNEREEGGYIIYGLDGVSGEFFVPNNRVLPYEMNQRELGEFIQNTNNSQIVPFEATNRAAVGGAKRKSKRNSKKKKRKSKRKKSKKKRYKRKKSKKRYRKKSKKR